MIDKAIPKLRFKGFISVWNLKELKDLFNRITNAYVGTVKKYYTNSFRGYFYLESNNIKRGKINLTNQVFVNNKFYKSQKKNWLHTGDIVMVQSGAVGDTAVIPKSLNNTAAHAVIVISGPKVPTDSHFLNDEFQSQYFKKEIYKLAIGNTVSHVLSSDIKRSLIKIPSLLEQHKIGIFFAILDRLIQLQQKKVSLLKRLKKAYLQKLFPRKNEITPRMRFKGFKNKWDEITINKLIVKGKSGGTPSKNNNKYYGGNIPFLSINDVTSSSGHINKTTKSITSLGLNNSSAWIIPKGSLILSMYASVGEVAQNNINLATSQAFFNMIYESSITTEMMYYVFQYIKLIHGWRPFINTGTQGNLNAHTIRQFIVKLPSLKEQRYISLFLKNLDINIHIQIDVSNNLSRLKKAYLQKMFC